MRVATRGVQAMAFDPADVIVPLSYRHPDEGLLVFSGTAFFLHDSGLLVTAAHCVEGHTGAFEIAAGKGERGPDGKAGVSRRAAEVIVIDSDADLAILKVETYRPKEAIRLYPGDTVPSNHFVMTYEYSTTSVERGKFLLAPATRIGNVTRARNFPSSRSKAGHMALELSFPALKGASGAPVLHWQTQALIGVVVANSSYHLLPAQIETVLDEKNEILEETKYMLPVGIAVNVRHLRSLLGRVAHLEGPSGAMA